MLLEFYSPHTIMNNELGRAILSWYVRFDLTGALMSENETALNRNWFIAAENFYRQRELDFPDQVEYKMNTIAATHHRVCADLALLFSGFKEMPDARVEQECEPYKDALETWYDRLHPSLRDERFFVPSVARQVSTATSIAEIGEACMLWKGPLYEMNFMYLDRLAMLMMFKLKTARRLSRPMPPELQGLALDASVRIEAIEHFPQSPTGALLRVQACLGMASLFLPKDERHIMWCRTKLARIENLG